MNNHLVRFIAFHTPSLFRKNSIVIVMNTFIFSDIFSLATSQIFLARNVSKQVVWKYSIWLPIASPYFPYLSITCDTICRPATDYVI